MDILPQLIVNALISGSIYALASSGLSLTYGLMRILNFAHGPLMMLGAYFFYFESVDRGNGVLISGLATALFGVLISIFALRIFILPFLSLSYLLPFVTTLALANILESVVSMVFGVNVKSLTLGSYAQSIELGGVYITPIQILIIASAVVLLSILAFTVHYTSVGRRIRALCENRYSAESLGVSQSSVVYGVFLVGTLLAMYAGILVGYETNLQPTMGSVYTVKAFAAMLLGGLGNIWGTVAGAYILGFVENLSIGLDFGGYSVPAGYKDAFAFLIILMVLMLRPQGLFMWRKRAA